MQVERHWEQDSADKADVRQVWWGGRVRQERSTGTQVAEQFEKRIEIVATELKINLYFILCIILLGQRLGCYMSSA